MINLIFYTRVALPIILLILVGLYQLKSKKAVSAVSTGSQIALFAITAIMLLLLSYSEHGSRYSTSVLGPALFTPGSLITRSVIFASTFDTRRLLEPSILFFVFFISVHASRFLVPSARKLFKISLILIPAILSIEGYYLQIQLNPVSSTNPPQFMIALLWFLSFVGIITSFALELSIKSQALFSNKAKSQNPLSPLIPAGMLWLLLIVLTFSGVFRSLRTDNTNYLAAHYYVWFPENWMAGYGGRAEPEKYPTSSLGEYQSINSSITQKHLEDMSEAGINLLLLDWWPRRPELKNRAVQVAKELEKHPAMRFAAHVETLDINKQGSRGVITLGESEVMTLSLFMQHLGKRLFSHPQYLKTRDGRPIVYLYASRHLVGDLGAALNQVKVHTKKTVGFEPFFIGDEVFPNVPEMKSSGATSLLPPLIPSWDRILAFDAITLYNPYNPDQRYPDGDEGLNLFFNETVELYQNYRAILEAAGKVFIPTIIPGYDDRALRPTLNSPPIPRYDSSGSSTLIEMANRVKSTMGKSMPGMAIITSWNEWNEGTQIEPGVIINGELKQRKANELSEVTIARDMLWR